LPDDLVNLAEQREQVLESWDREREDFVPLGIAAAITLHVCLADAAIDVASDSYRNALNVAAAALSRLIPIYLEVDCPQSRELIDVDIAKHRFQNGATELHSRDGETMAPLRVNRHDVLAAIPKCRQAGLLVWLSPTASGPHSQEPGTGK